MVDKKRFDKIREKAMKNIRKKYPGTHAIDVSDKNILEMGGLTSSEKLAYKKYSKELNESLMRGY